MMKNLHIPNPCSENWETMSPEEKGRFCSACNKCVIDFTQMQIREIRQIVEKEQNGDICGRFYNHQLDNENKRYYRLKDKFFRNLPAYLKNSKIALSVFSLILFLTGCSKPKENCVATTGLIVIEEDSIPRNDNYVIGKAKIQNDSATTIPWKDSIPSNNNAVLGAPYDSK